MKSSIFIPKKINVGFQERSDTYTKKLAYVIYYDEKGVLRKEKSWDSWRDKKIDNVVFDNVPTSGFVLNKKVGDYDSGWNHRHAYCRIYDPRNFEFEITIENLLYILENTNSIKGKGLEGDFVYAWDGKDLVIIPTSSSDYIEIEKYNSILHNNEQIKAKDLKVGATYLDKDNTEYIYMGKYDSWKVESAYYYNPDRYSSRKAGWDTTIDDTWRKTDATHAERDVNEGKRFWFATRYKDGDYRYGDDADRNFRFNIFKSVNKKFITCVSEECVSDYADIFDELERNCHYSPIDNSKDEYIDLTYDEFYDYVVTQNTYDWTRYTLSDEHERYEIKSVKHDDKLLYKCSFRKSGSDVIDTRFKYIEEEKIQSWGYGRVHTYREMIPVTLEEIYDVLKPCYRNKYLINGKFYKKEIN